jgi:hypothetical protein
MKQFNTPIIAIGAALVGAGAASFQVTGQWFSSLSTIAEHWPYVLTVAAVFGVVCGIASVVLNRR